MIEWMQSALKSLSIDEFERLVRKVADLYKSGCKIISVHRSENNKAKVVVQVHSGEKKLVIL